MANHSRNTSSKSSGITHGKSKSRPRRIRSGAGGKRTRVRDRAMAPPASQSPGDTPCAHLNSRQKCGASRYCNARATALVLRRAISSASALASRNSRSHRLGRHLSSRRQKVRNCRTDTLQARAMAFTR
jgi:hypothetical protein